jgi:transposase
VSPCDCLALRFSNAADHDDRTRRYPTDLTAEWEKVRDVLPLPRWLVGLDGRSESYCHRQMLDAVFYLVDGGIKWRAMPADFPAWDAVYRFFRRWLAQGLLAELHDRLRRRIRRHAGRDPEPVAQPARRAALRVRRTVPIQRAGVSLGPIPGRCGHPERFWMSWSPAYSPRPAARTVSVVRGCVGGSLTPRGTPVGLDGPMPVHIALVCTGRCRPSPDRVPLGASSDRDARRIVPGGLTGEGGNRLLPVLGAPLAGGGRVDGDDRDT